MFPFFEFLVHYVLDHVKDDSLVEFQKALSRCVEDLKTKDWETIPWLNQFVPYLELDEEDELPQMIADFLESAEEDSLEYLISEGTEIRLEAMIDQARTPRIPIENIVTTYTIEWEDGKTVDYVCKAFGVEKPFTIPFIHELTKTFGDQLMESFVYPGPDSIHATVAKPFDIGLFKKLMGVLYDHIEKNEPENYDQGMLIINRIYHRFLDFAATAGTGKIEFLEDTGGFSFPETEDD